MWWITWVLVFIWRYKMSKYLICVHFVQLCCGAIISGIHCCLCGWGGITWEGSVHTVHATCMGCQSKSSQTLFPVWQTGYTVEGRIIFFYTCPVIHMLHKLHTPHQQNHLYFLTVFINTELFLATRKSVIEGNFSSQFLSVKLTPNSKMKRIFYMCFHCKANNSKLYLIEVQSLFTKRITNLLLVDNDWKTLSLVVGLLLMVLFFWLVVSGLFCVFTMRHLKQCCQGLLGHSEAVKL